MVLVGHCLWRKPAHQPQIPFLQLHWMKLLLELSSGYLMVGNRYLWRTRVLQP
jgi:hypothetical protein